MDSRMNKYSDDKKMSRVSKNVELYKEISENELDNFSVKSNATVIGNQEPEIDIEKIKKILDKKYNEAPKRRSIRVEPREEESRLIDDVPTKEYDLNVILEKAKDEKIETYEEARAKKLRNTQFDILNNLNIEEDKIREELPVDVSEKPEMKKAEEDLMELIHTITINESKIRDEKEKNEQDDEIDPLSILEDLKGNEDTAVYDKMSEEISKEEVNEITEEKVTDALPKENKKIDDSFYTKSLFKKKDFEDNDGFDFADEGKLSIWVKILIVLVVVAFLVGLFIFLKSFLNF